MSNKEQKPTDLFELLIDAEQQYKLAVAVHSACTISKGNVFDYLETFAFGDRTVTKATLHLTPNEEERAASALEHSATYLLAVQVDKVLSEAVSDRFKHRDDNIRAASWIARLIRNAFTHNPLDPVWLIYPECDNKSYRVGNIAALDTQSLDGKRLRRMHYGGPLALLKLSEFTRANL